jgi:methyl-accepting chemotaxis protein
MSSTGLNIDATPSAPPSGAGGSSLAERARAWLPPLLLAVVAALGFTWAGPWGLLLVLPLVWWQARGAKHTGHEAPAWSGPGHAAAQLSSQVVPIWQRSIEAARQESERSTATLLESFAQLSATLDGAVAGGGASLSLGSVEELLAQQGAEIQGLTETTRRVAAMKDDMAGGMIGMAAQLEQLQGLAKTVQSIGRATHLLALNASVEASRSASAGSGFAVIAQEVRALAGQSRQAGQQIAQHVGAMQERIDALRGQVARMDTDDDELQRCAEEQARAMVVSVIGRVGEHMQASAQLREAGVTVQTELEKISMSLQSQDRQSQMLGSATEDMSRFVAWLAGNDDPAGLVPAEWLARLEASYTMEEMRSSHHGIVQIERQAAVEFF